MMIRYLSLIASLLVCVACTSPAKRFDQAAAEVGLTKSIVLGDRFSHAVYRNERPAAALTTSDRLHVYLGGDGTPWKALTAPSSEPTPRRPVGLAMLRQDSSPSIYLGRPCYHGLASSPGCSPIWWTHRRFSEEVIASMSAALKRIAAQYNHPEILLIGYSGGSVIARLLAERVPHVKAVITLAGNLDTAAWTDLHGYSPMLGSLNPTERPPLAAKIRQIHLFGGQDKNCPADLATRYFDKEPNALRRLYPGFNHRCCWAEQWPTILNDSLVVTRPR